MDSAEAPEHWNLKNPARVNDVAAAYVRAGADIILTNAFGGNRFKLQKVEMADHAVGADIVGRTAVRGSRA